MSDDIRLKFGVEGTAAAEAAANAVARTVSKVETVTMNSAKSTRQQGADLEAVGNKSERASSQLMQLGNAVALVSQSGGDLRVLSGVAREATGSLGDLGDTLVRMGGSKVGTGKLLQNLSGMLGPIAVAGAGATALYTVWKSLNVAAEKTQERLRDIEKGAKAITEAIKASELAQRDLNEAMLPPEQRAEVKAENERRQEAFREVAQPGGAMDPELLKLLTGKARTRLTKEFEESDEGKTLTKTKKGDKGKSLDRAILKAMDEIENLSAELQKPLGMDPHNERQNARDRIAKLQTELIPLNDARHKFEIQAAIEAKRTLETAVTDAKAARELYVSLGDEEKKLIDTRTKSIRDQQERDKVAEQTRKNMEEAEKQAEEEKKQRLAERAEADAKANDEINELRERSTTLLEGMLAAGRMMGDGLDEIAVAIAEHDTQATFARIGTNSKAFLAAVEREWQLRREAENKGLSGLEKAFEGEISIRKDAVRIAKEAAAEQAQFDKAGPAAAGPAAGVPAAAGPAAGEPGAAPATVTDPIVAELLRRLLGQARGQAGAAPGGLNARQLQQVLDQFRQQGGAVAGGRAVPAGARGPAAGPAGVQPAEGPEGEGERVNAARDRRTAAAKEKLRGGALRPKEVDAIREASANEAKEAADARRKEFEKKQQDEQGELRREAGFGKVDPRAAAGLSRRQRMEKIAFDREEASGKKQDARQGKQGGDDGDLAGQLDQAAKALGKSGPEAAQETMGLIMQIIGALQNQDSMNTGLTQSMRTARQQIPGPGARRR